MLPWILCGVLTIIVIVLVFKIMLMRKSMYEIIGCMREHLSTDTNNQIFISSNDKYVKQLAIELNRQLMLLRRKRQQYLKGDQELKDAVINISHDLRTPLTSIFGYLELLDREDKSEAAKRYLSKIQNRTETLKTLTEELFRYSVLSSDSLLLFEDVNLCRLLEDSLVSFYTVFEQKGIVPQIQIPECAIIRKLDASSVSRVFDNIISNAVKYSNGDFSVVMHETGEINFSNAAKALSKVDTAKLFDRFYTVDSARKSSGLGLSIAKLLTERMKGTIKADYQEGKLCITVTFLETGE